MKVISGSTNKETLILYVCVYLGKMLKGKVFEIVSFKLVPNIFKFGAKYASIFSAKFKKI